MFYFKIQKFIKLYPKIRSKLPIIKFAKKPEPKIAESYIIFPLKYNKIKGNYYL